MNKLKFLLILLCIGCSGARVAYDYDSNTNFKEYKSFKFFEDTGKGFNDLDIKRLTSEISRQLTLKNIKPSDTPDMFINFFSEKRPAEKDNFLGIGIGTGSGIFDIGVSGDIPLGSREIRQTITIDFVDAETNSLIWQGTVSTNIKEPLTPSQKEVYFSKVLNKAFNKYPPNK